MNQEQREFFDRLRSDGVISAVATLTPLGGGVSSDIYLVTDDAREFVVKRALTTLRVQDEWLADVSRNEFEQRYLRYVGQFLPDAVPQIIKSGQGYFAMEFLGAEFKNWKAELLAGTATALQAKIAGETLGAIHARSQDDPQAMQQFDSGENFTQLRIDPYFRTIAQRIPEIASLVETEASRLLETRECVVHGDYSPKNLIFSDNRMVVLDCEVAWYGDPAFDLAFCLSHLLLKALYHAPKDVGVGEMTRAFAMAYFDANPTTADRRNEIEDRTVRLLLLLVLARIDSKSPVEYLDATRQEFARNFALTQLQAGSLSQTLELCSQWLARLGQAKLPG